MTWILANIKLVATIAALLGLTVFLSVIYYKGKAACEAEVIYRTVTKTIEVKKEHDKIRNHRLTTNGVITSLQNGSF